jgi:hypothetical protein
VREERCLIVSGLLTRHETMLLESNTNVDDTLAWKCCVSWDFVGAAGRTVEGGF